MELKNIKITKKISIFLHKVSKPCHYEKLYGINQLSACCRDGNFDSWDFIGNYKEVSEYENQWCQNGTNGFGFLGIKIIKGFNGQGDILKD